MTQAVERTEALGETARGALVHYDLNRPVTCELVHISENATFRVVEADGHPWALRVHRLGYQTAAAIESELAWMAALRAEAGVRSPRVRASLTGHRVVGVTDPRSGALRSCVLFEWLSGQHPSPQDESSFESLGVVTARMHRHSRGWRRPAGFTRFSWDLEAAFGRDARWGPWRGGMGVGPAESELLGRLERVLRRRLLAYGNGADRFGLVHADTRLANLLVDEGEVRVIDFDDSGFSWHLYDLATAFSFFEDAPRVPELIDRWLSGYRSVVSLPSEDEAEIWTFILFRRLLLVAWLGSHPTVDLARQLGSGYTAGTCVLAEWYLCQHD